MEIEINYDEVAMKLFTLLSQNLLGDFHTEIESLDQAAYQNTNINKIIAMEQYFIEGRYNKVIEIVQTLQLGDISALLPQLRQTVVDAITQTLQSAYKTLPIDYAKKVLMISNDDELNAIVVENEWVVENGYIIFNHNQNDKKKGESMKSFDNVSNTLSLIKDIDEMI